VNDLIIYILRTKDIISFFLVRCKVLISNERLKVLQSFKSLQILIKQKSLKKRALPQAQSACAS